MTKNYIAVNVQLTGKNLYAAIKSSGYSVREIQEMLDFSCPQSIYRWIHGLNLPSLENLYRLSQILQIPMEELIVAENITIDKQYEY